MTRNRWWSLLIVGVYLFVVVVAFLAARANEDRINTACADRRDGRQVLREVVVKATEPGQRVDLTKVPGFDGLEPSTQTYLENLSSALNVNQPSTEQPLRDRLLALIPPIDC